MLQNLQNFFWNTNFNGRTTWHEYEGTTINETKINVYSIFCCGTCFDFCLLMKSRASFSPCRWSRAFIASESIKNNSNLMSYIEILKFTGINILKVFERTSDNKVLLEERRFSNWILSLDYKEEKTKFSICFKIPKEGN